MTGASLEVALSIGRSVWDGFGDAAYLKSKLPTSKAVPSKKPDRVSTVGLLSAKEGADAGQAEVCPAPIKLAMGKGVPNPGQLARGGLDLIGIFDRNALQ